MFEYVRYAKDERETIAISLNSNNSNLANPELQDCGIAQSRSEKNSGLISMIFSKIQEDKETISDDVKLLTLKLLGSSIELW